MKTQRYTNIFGPQGDCKKVYTKFSIIKKINKHFLTLKRLATAWERERERIELKQY